MLNMRSFIIAMFIMRFPFFVVDVSDKAARQGDSRRVRADSMCSCIGCFVPTGMFVVVVASGMLSICATVVVINVFIASLVSGFSRDAEAST